MTPQCLVQDALSWDPSRNKEIRSVPLLSSEKTITSLPHHRHINQYLDQYQPISTNISLHYDYNPNINHLPQSLSPRDAHSAHAQIRAAAAGAGELGAGAPDGGQNPRFLAWLDHRRLHQATFRDDSWVLELGWANIIHQWLV